MAYLRKATNFRKLSKERIEAWKKIATASASDMMNRSGAMGGAIKPVTQATSICGQARTIQCIMADNSILHYATSTAEAGEVLVVDAGGIIDVAVWGGLTTIEAYRRGLAGLIVDGAVRDIREARSVPFPIFCKGIVPQGPHKAFGGMMDVAISCGGRAVSPGDLILADDDGVVVVPLDREEEVFRKAVEFRRDEEAWLKQLDTDKPFYQVLGIPTPELIA
jgi:4-hydroxy-4-methyl-2-oxoglutarate aldolase